MIEKGVAAARAVLATGDKSALAAYLLDMPVERVRAVASRSRSRFNNDLRYSDGTDDRHRQLTPGYVLHPVRQALDGIGLDPCTEPDNPVGAHRFYTRVDDGLVLPWSGPGWRPSVYVNPPYAKAREPWVARCVDAGAGGQAVVLLMPAHTDTRLFHNVLESVDHIVFLRGRVKFGVLRKNGRQEAASHPSALFGWNVDLRPCCGLGTLVFVGRT